MVGGRIYLCLSVKTLQKLLENGAATMREMVSLPLNFSVSFWRKMIRLPTSQIFKQLVLTCDDWVSDTVSESQEDMLMRKGTGKGVMVSAWFDCE